MEKEKSPDFRADEIGTVISSIDGPSPSALDVVIYSGKLHRGQFVEMDYSEGTLVCLVTDVIKTNRYFERVESVKEFEATGNKLFEQFPAGEWEYLVAKTRPLGVYQGGLIKRATFPPSPGTKVKIAVRPTIEKFLGFDLESGLHLGEIEHHETPVKLNLSRLFQKHLAILAMSGAGKCLTGGTKILLENDEQKTIANLVDSVLDKGKVVEDGVEFWQQDFGIKTFAFSEEHKIIPAKILGFYRRKSPEFLVCIKTRTGRKIELTPEHFVPIFDGKLDWKPAGELSAEDYVFLPRIDWIGDDTAVDFTNLANELKGVNVSGNRAMQMQSKISVPLRHEVDNRLARMFAYLLAEGHNTLKSRVTFTNENKKLQRDFSEICVEKFGFAPKMAKIKGELYVDSVILARCLANFGFTNSSWTKFIPVEILKAKKPVLENFFASFVDCDGYVNPNKPEINVTVASQRLAEGIGEILTKLGVIFLKKIKKINGKEYQMVIVSGSTEIRKLGGINLLVDYKKQALGKWISAKSNTNIDVVPNLHSHFMEILRLLRMPQPQAESTGICNYLYRKNNPSRESLVVLISAFERRAEEVGEAITQAKQLNVSTPEMCESGALEIVKCAYSSGVNFKQIALESGVSSTTARRVVRGITSPKSSVFLLAKNAAKLQGLDTKDVDFVSIFDGNKALFTVKEICDKLNYSAAELCLTAGCHHRFLYEHSLGRGTPEQSKVVSIVKGLNSVAESAASDLLQARGRIGILKQVLEMNAFFDKISSVERVRSVQEFVYDLSVENSNFVANNILVHNSYLVSVLLEELLQRKKENGRIGVIVMDAHGEYRSFAEPVKDKKHVDFSSKTRFVRAGEIQIGVPKLSIGLLSAMIPGLSAPQRRDLSRVFDKLRREMKDGLGPFDFGAVRSEVLRDEEIKGQTKDALIGWIVGLEQLGIFGKADSPSISDIVRPGQLTIIDLSDIIELKKKQIIVAYYARKLFDERRQKKVPPFTVVVEEAHNFCLSSDAEILTPNGWKCYEKLAVGQLAYSYNKESGKLEPNPIERVIVRDYSGEMVKLSNQDSIDAIVTPDHRVLCNVRTTGADRNWRWSDSKFVFAKDLPGGFRIPVTAPIENISECAIDDELLKTIGWIITDGHLHKYHNNKYSYFEISQAESKGATLQEMISVVKNRFQEATVNPRTKPVRQFDSRVIKSTDEYTFYLGAKASGEIKKWLAETPHRIPRKFIENASLRQLKLLFDALVQGDGTKYKSKNGFESIVFYPGKDKCLADDFQELCTRLGFSATVRNNSWNHQINVLVSLKRKFAHIRKSTKEQYAGKVWDITVKHGAFVARRNGKVFITGNCPEKTPKENSISKHVIETIAREGRKFGASICLISQRPVNLSTTALSQCNTHIILRVTNPYDLDHIKQTSEGIDQRTVDMITSLRTGEAIIVGEAVNYPSFFKVRKRLSQESRHETTLEKAAVDFEDTKEAVEKDVQDLL
ncbi:DNA double-strand break repair helicase HerA [uncultured archaeon]|nr:DNA double-strand break repair helicase HerA [uncultured archaeon]